VAEVAKKEEAADSLIEAVRMIYDALVPLDSEGRHRALASAMSLLGMETGRIQVAPEALEEGKAPPATPPLSTTRPISLLELSQEKKPTNNAERIALFAYYRERYEGVSRFSRSDLRTYFARARLSPPANYDRDFNNAVSNAWIHEDGAESYLTSKGLEAVESGFAAGQPSPSSRRSATRKKPAARRATPRKRTSK
jgi:hypothetical protein